MANLAFISEYANIMTVRGKDILAPVEPAITTQVVNYGAGATQSAAFNSATRFVRITSDTNCFFLFGTNPTAVTSSSPRLAAGASEYFSLDKVGQLKVSFVA